METKEYMLKGGLLDRRRKLILAPDHIAYENKNLVNDAFTSIEKTSLADVVFRHEFIEWYEITVGRRFVISLKSTSEAVLHISFCSYFGANKHYRELYTEITGALWEHYLPDVLESHLRRVSQSGRIDMLDVTVRETGLTFDQKAFAWHDVEFKEYYSYFTIYSKNSPAIHKHISFDEWGAEMLLAVLRTLKNQHAS